MNSFSTAFIDSSRPNPKNVFDLVSDRTSTNLITKIPKCMDTPAELKVNVLLVDDRPENLLALEAILQDPTYNLIKAKSGEEALKCVLQQDFAVILLDVQMPGMSGFETATMIRTRPRSRSTPIIFVTAFNTSDTQVFQGYALGAVDYLFKPIKPEILTSKVAVFVELYKKTEEVKQQAALLANINLELRESEERFRCLSACSPVGIYLTDTKGRFTYMNPRCQGICGLKFEERLVEGWLQSVHPEDREPIVARWVNSIEYDREYVDEFRLLVNASPYETGAESSLRSSKTPFINPKIVRWVRVQSSPMFSDAGELIGRVGTVEDITEHKQAEEERGRLLREQLARQEAERANQMKDEFLAILSHELRTPLNAILGWSKLLQAKKFDEATINKALETIERNAKCQAQLIEDILDVSRILRGKLHLKLRPIQLEPIIEAALEILGPMAEAKAIAIEVVSQLNASQKVKGDADRLQQVVWNLLSNAIKFTPQGGTVEIRLVALDGFIQIQVIDTGIGINPDFLPYVFDRFRQADSSTTRSYGGLGLGLAIVHHLVDLHKGRVRAENNTDGPGAKFTVLLPLLSDRRLFGGDRNEKGLELPPGSEEGSMDEGSMDAGDNLATLLADFPSIIGLQVLIVDDDDDSREFITVVLEEQGVQVLAVASAQEAIGVLNDFQPDLLISDIGMPNEDGYDLISRVRSREAKRGSGIMPAIALTAYARSEERRRALAAGFQMHLSKPVEPSELIVGVAKMAGLLNASVF